jgi:hypothetical protein
VEVMRSRPPSTHQPLEHCSPLITLVLHEYHSARHRAIISKEGSEPG